MTPSALVFDPFSDESFANPFELNRRRRDEAGYADVPIRRR